MTGGAAAIWPKKKKGGGCEKEGGVPGCCVCVCGLVVEGERGSDLDSSQWYIEPIHPSDAPIHTHKHWRAAPHKGKQTAGILNLGDKPFESDTRCVMLLPAGGREAQSRTFLWMFSEPTHTHTGAHTHWRTHTHSILSQGKKAKDDENPTVCRSVCRSVCRRHAADHIALY